MSDLEAAMLYFIKVAGLPEPQQQLVFAPPRKFRFDFAYPDQLVALECDGATWANGRHNRGAGIESDCEKFSLAACMGWRVLRVTSKQIDDGRAVAWLARALAGGHDGCK